MEAFSFLPPFSLPEMEQVLYGYPGILECAVIGKCHEEGGNKKDPETGAPEMIPRSVTCWDDGLQIADF